MSKKYETSVYTKDQLDNARFKGQLKGWVQGTITTVILLAAMKFLAWLWIPILILMAVLGMGGYSYVKKKTRKSDL